jgi:hypothetical protein
MRLDEQDINKALSNGTFDFNVVIDSNKAESAKITFTTADAAEAAIASITQVYI